MLYQSSKGAVEIDTMPLAYASNALNKLTRDEPSRADEIDALKAHVDKLSSEVAADAPPPMGHNGPPEDEVTKSPFETARDAIEDMYAEAKNWLDGAPIENQAQANVVGKIIDDLRKAKKLAEDNKGSEKRPHLDANIEIEARYKPLVTKAETAIKTALAAQGVFLRAQQDEHRRLADAAAKRASEEAAAAAAAAQAATRAGDLTAREEAEAMIEQAQSSLGEAKMLDGLKATAKGEDQSKAIGLVTRHYPVMTDPTLALRHYWGHPDPTYRRDIEELAIKFAQRDVRGGARSIPGFRVDSEQVAR